MALLAEDGRRGGVEVDDGTASIKDAVTGDDDFLIGGLGVQVEGESGLTEDARGTAQVANLDEIIGVSGKAGLSSESINE